MPTPGTMTMYLALATIAVLLLLWAACLVLLLLITWGIIFYKVPFVPTPGAVVSEALKLLPLSAGGTLYDIWSGNGRVVFAFANAYPSARVIGVEASPFPFLLTLLRRWGGAARNASFLFKDFSNVSLAGASHVYTYLLPSVMARLLPRFEKELAPGTRVLSCDFPFKSRTPLQTAKVNVGKFTYTLYVYEF